MRNKRYGVESENIENIEKEERSGPGNENKPREPKENAGNVEQVTRANTRQYERKQSSESDIKVPMAGTKP
jgi:hypothetical protein